MFFSLSSNVLLHSSLPIPHTHYYWLIKYSNTTLSLLFLFTSSSPSFSSEELQNIHTHLASGTSQKIRELTGKILEGGLDVPFEGLVVEVIRRPARDAPKTQLLCKLHVCLF